MAERSVQQAVSCLQCVACVLHPRYIGNLCCAHALFAQERAGKGAGAGDLR